MAGSRRCTYVETAGGFGPFLRIDMDDLSELATYYGTVVSSVQRTIYDRHFMTVTSEKNWT